jgi:peptide deformylase
MAVLPVLTYPDPRLRLRCEPVERFDADLARLVDDLLETMYASRGIGLSAPQVGDARQVLVADLSEDGSDPQVYVNPGILSHSTPGLVQESCLSVPGVVGNLVRATRLQVRARDVTGMAFDRDLEDMHAVCVQHEMEHLAGRLFIDRLSPLRRLRLRLAAALRTRGGAEADSAQGGRGAA